MSALELVAVSKSFGPVRVLRDLDLTVAQGSLTAVLGPSGSGKTTLLRVIAGFERADSGSVTLDKVTVDDGRRYLPTERRGLGYVPQEGALFPHLSVAANVGFGLRGRRDRRRRVDELLELVDLAGEGDRHPYELSGGQQQRVALARALAVAPRMLLLDEPFTALDPALRASVRAEVGQIIRRAGTTAILVTHDQDEALSMADEVAVLRDGVVIQHAPPHQLYSQPMDPALARFLGDANLLPATVQGGHALTALGPVLVQHAPHADANGHGAPFPEGAAVIALLRPEQLRIRSTAPEPAPATHAAGAGEQARTKGELTGRVVHSEYYGHDAVVRIRPEAPHDQTELLIVRLSGEIPPQLGALVTLTAEGPVTIWSTLVPDSGTSTPSRTSVSGAR